MVRQYSLKIKENSHLDFNLKGNGKMVKLNKDAIKSINLAKVPSIMNSWWSTEENFKSLISMAKVKGPFTIRMKE